MPPQVPPEEKRVENQLILPTKTSFSYLWLLLLPLLAFLLGSMFAGYMFYGGSITDEEEGEPYTPTLPITEIVTEDNLLRPLGDNLPVDRTDYSTLYKNLVKQDGVTWLSSPKALGDLGLLKPKRTGDSRGGDTPVLQYYQIGDYLGKLIVFITDLPCLDMMCAEYAMFLVPSSGAATLLTQHSQIELISEWGALTLTAGVIPDSDFILEALAAERKIQLNDFVELAITSWSGLGLTLFAESPFNQSSLSTYTDIKFLADTKHGPLFVAHEGVSDDGTIDYKYALRLPGGLIVNYNEVTPGFITDDRIPQITWFDGTKNTQVYRSDRLTGCGGGGPTVVAQPLTEPAIKLAGTTVTGEKVYNLIDHNNPLIERVFTMTEGIVYEYVPGSASSNTYTVTREEFIANYGVILVENKIGQQWVFTNSKYGPQAECGKPVIYLYPEATTTVTVKVDALITKSDPLYQDGWVATAHPDGLLLVDGEEYTSLFWDGYGNGEYPVLTEGFVVSTSEAISTMMKHLQVIGFNENEIAEFAEFWSDHLPEEPYTRISWIQTADMEKMARLDITPRPDTLIRAFVDYEGVEKYFSLKPQVLLPRVRSGYTVTEWGGLLRR